MSEMHSDRTIRFLCDQNLGRLAKWLRVLGFDTELMKYWDEAQVDQAFMDGRIVLTRKRTVKTCAPVIVVPHDHLDEQMRLLGKTFDLRRDSRPFSRCTICNAPLVSVSREEVRGLVPEYVYATHESFSSCPLCRRTYWKGTHFDKVQCLMGEILKKD